jgi:hypothetical protein
MVTRAGVAIATFRVRCYPPNTESKPAIVTDIYKGYVPVHIDVMSQASSYSGTYILNFDWEVFSVMQEEAVHYSVF